MGRRTRCFSCLAQKAAGGRDVRIGGGPSTLRQFLQADLLDFMHLVIVPITLGRGVSLWEGSSGLQDRFTVESVTSSSGLIHQLWNKRRATAEPRTPKREPLVPRQTDLICTPRVPTARTRPPPRTARRTSSTVRALTTPPAV